MVIKYFTVGPFQENTYIVTDPESKDSYVIDPGGWNEQVLSHLRENKLNVKAIVSTHGHIDHIAGAFDLRKSTKAPYRLSQKDEFMLEDLDRICSSFGFPKVTKPVVDADLKDGEVLELGQQQMKVIETPGHTPGGVCFRIDNHIFVGDTLFYGSIGRTDLPGGNHEQLIDSIKSKILILPENMIVHCGHGPETTIGHEKKTNPFLSGANAFF